MRGVNPDPLRDYFLELEIPDLISRFSELKMSLEAEAQRLETLTGHKGTEAALLLQVSRQLESMIRRPETISERLTNYRDNVAALGAWILRIKEMHRLFGHASLFSDPGLVHCVSSAKMRQKGFEVRRWFWLQVSLYG